MGGSATCNTKIQKSKVTLNNTQRLRLGLFSLLRLNMDTLTESDVFKVAQNRKWRSLMDVLDVSCIIFSFLVDRKPAPYLVVSVLRYFVTWLL